MILGMDGEKKASRGKNNFPPSSRSSLHRSSQLPLPAPGSVIGRPHSLRAPPVSHPPGTRKAFQARLTKSGLVGCPRFPDLLPARTGLPPFLDHPAHPTPHVFLAPRVTGTEAVRLTASPPFGSLSLRSPGAHWPGVPVRRSLHSRGSCHSLDLVRSRWHSSCRLLMSEFKEKFIAFIDILGFKRLVEDAEAGKGLPLTQLTKLLESFGSAEERDK